MIYLKIIKYVVSLRADPGRGNDMTPLFLIQIGNDVLIFLIVFLELELVISSVKMGAEWLREIGERGHLCRVIPGFLEQFGEHDDPFSCRPPIIVRNNVMGSRI